MSAINFNASVEKVEKDGADYVKLTFLGESVLPPISPAFLNSLCRVMMRDHGEFSGRKSGKLTVSIRLTSTTGKFLPYTRW